MKKVVFLLIFVVMIVSCGGGGKDPEPAKDEIPYFENTELTIENIGMTGFTVKWNAAKDDKGISKYVLYTNDELFKEIDGNNLLINLENLDINTQYKIKLEAIDTDNNKSKNSLEDTAKTNDFPQNINEVASKLQPNLIYDFAPSIDFLYKGNNKLQFGLDESVIDAKRVIVIKGKVLNDNNEGISGVKIEILNKNEYGYTFSRNNGEFDIALNGGGVVILNYKKDGFINVQRKVQTGFNDFFYTEDAVMIPYDENSTQINSSFEEIQTAKGSVTTDTDGERQGMIIFPKTVKVKAKNKKGKEENLDKFNVRITEFTVGDNGIKRMPGELPPTSGYTYAMELSVDGFENDNIEFDKPLYYYVDNFLNFPVGGKVPLGYYDRNQGIWIPSKNGVVLKVLNIENNIAKIDIDGDDIEDDLTKLEQFGFTEDELKTIASQYQAGKSYWRVEISHFTPWDCNWPYGCSNCDAPSNSDPQPDDECDPCNETGSIIGVQNQTLGEQLPVKGTNFALTYKSDRVKGNKSKNILSTTITKDELPPNIKRIVVETEVAGKKEIKEYEPQTNLNLNYEFDGLDVYGRKVQGGVPYKVKIGYVYDATYMEPAEFQNSFAQYSNVEIEGNQTREEITLSQSFNGFISKYDFKEEKNGGWNLSPYHIFDIDSKIFYGYGKDDIINNINNLYVTEKKRYIDIGSNCQYTNFVKDNNNNFYFMNDKKLYKYNYNTNESLVIYENDNISCSMLNIMFNISVDNDNNLYITNATNKTIDKIDSNGNILKIYENIVQNELDLFMIQDISVDVNGNIYFVDSVQKNVIRKLSPDGTNEIIAGKLTGGSTNNNIPALTAKFKNIRNIQVDNNGTIYFIDDENIKSVDSNGTMKVIVNKNTITDIIKFELDKKNNRLYIVTNYKNITEFLYRYDLAKNNYVLIGGSCGKNIQELNQEYIMTCSSKMKNIFELNSNLISTIGFFQNVKVDNNGNLYVFVANDLIKITNKKTDKDYNVDFSFPSKDGSLLYVFNQFGKHIKTVDSLTNKTVYEFTHNDKGYLTEIKDLYGRITKIERNTDDYATKIISPYDEETILTINSNGYLESLKTSPDIEWKMEYKENGLLTKFTNPKDNSSQFYYDDNGLLTKDQNAAGGFKEIEKTGSNLIYSITLSTAMGRETKYETKVTESEKEWNITNSAGQCTNSIQKNGGETVINKPNGMKAITTTQADSRFGDNSPFTSNVKAIFPSGKETQISFTQNIELEDPNNVTSVKKLTTETTINGTRKVKREYDNILKTFVVTSPLNKQSKSTFDEFGRVIKEENPGFYAVNYTYDEFGKLKTMSQGSGNEERKATFYYDEKERLVKIEDNSGDNEQYFYDEKGRLYKTILPNGKEVIEDFDKNNNTTKITLPNEEQHKFEYTSIDQIASYEAPNETITSYDYNLDGQMTQITEPINEEVIYNYNSSSGVLESIVYPDTTINYLYNDVTGNITSVSKGNETLAYTYDGGLLLSEESTGNINGLVEYNYDNDLRISSVKVNDISINYSFNDDNELLSVNDLTITNDETTGFIKETNIDNIKEKYEYNQFGEVKKYEVFYSNNLIYSESYVYNTKGFIEVKTVINNNVTDIFNYTYDKIGQLTEVTKNNSTIETYSYDSNGNRLNNNAQYDSQDRLISNSSTTFGYTERGTLLTRTENSQITSYSYDLMGNLLSVSLPNNTNIEYITDARNRRIAKKVNGIVTQKFLYLNQLKPIAELDANDNIISLFIYGTRSNTPDYIIKNNVKYKVITNQLGSVVKVVNTTNGTVEQAIEYDSFGNILSDTNPNFQPFRLAGGLYDNDTKLIRFGARDYDAREGRWTTKDPIKFDGGMNFYVYAGNNPVNYVDLDGENATGGMNVLIKRGLSSLDLYVIETLQKIICESIKEDKEYITNIYRENASFKEGIYGKSRKWGKSGKKGVGLLRTEPGSKALAHTHGCARWKGDGEEFSNSQTKDITAAGDDETMAKNADIPSYLATPTGRVLKMTFDNKGTAVINEIGKLDVSKCKCPKNHPNCLK